MTDPNTTQSYLDLAAELLGAIGTIAAGPAGAAIAGISSIATFAATLIKQGEAGAEQLAELTTQVKAMAAAGRNPTDDEWAALVARSDAAHAAIQAAAAGG